MHKRSMDEDKKVKILIVTKSTNFLFVEKKWKQNVIAIK